MPSFKHNPDGSRKYFVLHINVLDFTCPQTAALLHHASPKDLKPLKTQVASFVALPYDGNLFDALNSTVLVSASRWYSESQSDSYSTTLHCSCR